MWVLASDALGNPCWRNTLTGAVDYNVAARAGQPPALPQVAPMGFVNVNNAPVPFVYPAAGAAAEAFRREAEAAAWIKVVDKQTDKPYWHNTMTKKTTWDKPKVETTPPPPPPPPPQAPKPKPKKRPEREADQWEVQKDKEGNRYFYNTKTGKPQYDRPDCLRKYPPTKYDSVLGWVL